MPKYDVTGRKYESPAEFGAYYAANHRPWAAATPQRPAPIGQVREMGRQQNLSGSPLAQQSKKEERAHTQMQQQQQQFQEQQQQTTSFQMGAEIIQLQLGGHERPSRQFQDRSEPTIQMGGNDVALPQPERVTSLVKPARRVEQQLQTQRYRVVQYG